MSWGQSSGRGRRSPSLSILCRICQPGWCGVGGWEGWGWLGEQTTHLCTFYLPRPDLQLKMLPDMPVHHGTSSGEALSPESGDLYFQPHPMLPPPYSSPVTFSRQPLSWLSSQKRIRSNKVRLGTGEGLLPHTPPTESPPLVPSPPRSPHHPGPLTWLPLRPIQGSWPYVNISHSVTPNIQVSLA